MLAGEHDPAQGLLPEPPVAADLARAIGQVGAAGQGVLAVAAQFEAFELFAGAGIELVEADQHLVDQLPVTEGLHQARVVTGQVDQQVSASLERRLDPEHAQALVAIDLAG
ncbi:hypothetical protein D3C81_1953090 [compost metagenome]